MNTPIPFFSPLLEVRSTVEIYRAICIAVLYHVLLWHRRLISFLGNIPAGLCGATMDLLLSSTRLPVARQATQRRAQITCADSVFAKRLYTFALRAWLDSVASGGVDQPFVEDHGEP